MEREIVDNRPAQSSQSNETDKCTASAHHWLIERPQGKLSQGTCKKCGSERFFRNSLQSEGTYNPFKHARSNVLDTVFRLERMKDKILNRDLENEEED